MTTIAELPAEAGRRVAQCQGCGRAALWRGAAPEGWARDWSERSKGLRLWCRDCAPTIADARPSARTVSRPSRTWAVLAMQSHRQAQTRETLMRLREVDAALFAAHLEVLLEVARAEGAKNWIRWGESATGRRKGRARAA